MTLKVTSAISNLFNLGKFSTSTNDKCLVDAKGFRSESVTYVLKVAISRQQCTVHGSDAVTADY